MRELHAGCGGVFYAAVTKCLSAILGIYGDQWSRGPQAVWQEGLNSRTFLFHEGSQLFFRMENEKGFRESTMGEYIKSLVWPHCINNQSYQELTCPWETRSTTRKQCQSSPKHGVHNLRHLLRPISLKTQHITGRSCF